MATIAEALQIASQYHRQNCLNEAQQIYQQILEQQPDHPDALQGLALIAQQLEDYQTAEKLLRQALQSHPNSVKVWFSLGNLHQVQGQLTEAVAAYQSALSIKPNLAPIYNNLGYTLQQLHKLDDAIACYQKALSIQPNFVEVEVNLGNALHLQGKLSSEQKPHYAALNNDLGVNRNFSSDLKTAETYYRQAIALQPDLVIAHYNLGITLQKTGNLPEAINCYQNIVSVKTNDTDGYYQVANYKLNRLKKTANKIPPLNSKETLKIAFVNQFCDTLLPPAQNSVGACTYGIARPLAECYQVFAYALKHNPELASEYDNQGVNYRFISPLPFDLKLFNLFKKYAKYLKPFNRGYIPPSSTSRWVFPMYGRQVAKELRPEQFDIIHFQHTTQYIPIVRALNPKAKIILNLHHEFYAQTNLKMIERRLRHVDFVTCVSDFVAEKVCQHFPQIAHRCQTIYNGIEASDFARTRDYNEAKQRQVKRIMYAGAMSPEKGIHVLLDALKIVVQSYPDATLEFYGPGARPIDETLPLDDRALLTNLKPVLSEDYGSHLQKIISPEIAAKVFFRGMVPRSQLIDSYFQADIFVFPSLWDEGFGIPPVEAMAAGTPVVATKSGAVVETVQHGKTGFLVNKNDAPALASALLQLLENDDLRESMGRAARKRAIECFSWDKSAETLLQLCEQLCKDKVEPVSIGETTKINSASVPVMPNY
jgi:glycosyltransferase involved in cell wall biosynthesis/Tfp pilus assembly protein PilF